MLLKTLLAAFIFAAGITAAHAQGTLVEKLTPEEIRLIGERVFENECGAKDGNLVTWNEGEDFLSLGIGHFIWYPAGGDKTFLESFGRFIEYAKADGEKIPLWLDKEPFPPCPWSSRGDFLNAGPDPRLSELKDLLKNTKSVQAEFIAKQLEDSLPLLIESAPAGTRDKITLQFNRVASTFQGICALADYLNFKGLGIARSESYQGKGWGLLQVLEGMRDENEAPDALSEFTRAAKIVLEERVKNSPPGRNEQKWLPGWKKRVNKYLDQL